MKLVRLDSLFNISSGNDLELCYLNKSKNGINFVSRTSKNHGVSAIVDPITDFDSYINKAGTITVAVGGSVLETFLQTKDYYTGFHVKILTPKIQMSDKQKIYYCLCIKQNQFRYNFGRQANTSLGALDIPDFSEIPLWLSKIELKDISYYQQSFSCNTTPVLNISKWKPFKIRSLFHTISRGLNNNAGILERGDDIWYIGAKKKENGLMKKVKLIPELVSKGNCMVLINNGQGSVGYANYMDKDFIATADVYTAYSEFLDKYIGLFFAGMFNANRFRYNFGRKWVGERLLDSEILLPIVCDKKGVPILDDKISYIPDYNYMRDYIKTLPFSKYI